MGTGTWVGIGLLVGVVIVAGVFGGPYLVEMYENYTKDESTDWTCVAGSPAPLALNKQGDTMCMSTDGENCLSPPSCANTKATPPANLKPVVCGEALKKSKWAVTGYETDTHWCSFGKKALGKK
jgi:hypothetical protein